MMSEERQLRLILGATTKGTLGGAVISVLAFLLCLTYAILGLGCQPVDDRGFISVDGRELIPFYWAPCGVAGLPSLEDDGLEDIPDLAAEWWNAQLDRPVWNQEEPAGCIFIDTNFIAEPSHPEYQDINTEAETARLVWDEDYNIIQCSILLNVDLAYDRETMFRAAIHALGHCLALDDDPGITETVELRSVMGSPMDPLGELTDHDRALLQAWWDER